MLCENGYKLIGIDSHPKIYNFNGLLIANDRYGGTMTSFTECRINFDKSEIINTTFYDAYSMGYKIGSGVNLNNKFQYMEIIMICRAYKGIYYIDACTAGAYSASKKAKKMSKKEFEKRYNFITIRNSFAKNGL